MALVSSDYAFIGPFVDYFPNPRTGLHFGATVGLAGPLASGSSDSTSSSDKKSAGPGIGGIVFGGYDIWIADQWSIGASARLLVLGGNDDFGVKHTAIIPHILVSALYH